MKKIVFSIFALVILLLTACLPQAAPTPIIVKIEVTATPQTAQTAMPIAIPTLARPTQVPTLKPTATPTSTVSCISLEPELPADLEFSGVWVMGDFTPYVYNLAENTKYRLPLEGGGPLTTWYGNDLAISPDGTHMAYIDQYYTSADGNRRLNKRILRVIRSSGHALDMSFWSQDWQDILGWVDNQNLALRDGHGRVVILNPISGKWHEFSQSSALNTSTNSSYWNQPQYSPNLAWLVDNPDYDQTILKNTQTGETVWKMSGHGGTHWSVNNTLAVISDNMITILFDGKPTEQLVVTRLGINYPSSPKLSPNGEKLFFRANKNDSTSPYILNIGQHQIAQFCNNDFSMSWYTTPAWSPDGRFLVQGIYRIENGYYRDYDLLIDTQTLSAYLINSGNSQHIIAWLAQP